MSAAAVRTATDARPGCTCRRARQEARLQQCNPAEAGRNRTLCFECYRAERERRHASARLERTEPPMTSPFGHQAERPPLDNRQTAHRRRMLEWLEGQVSAAARSARRG